MFWGFTGTNRAQSIKLRNAYCTFSFTVLPLRELFNGKIKNSPKKANSCVYDFFSRIFSEMLTDEMYEHKYFEVRGDLFLFLFFTSKFK